MEITGKLEGDYDPVGGGEMKKLKMTKREAAITFLEMCHGYLVLFAIYACAVVTSGHGNEPFIQVGLLLFPVNAILFAAVRWAGHFWQYGLVAALAVVGADMVAGDRKSVV